MKNKIRDDPDPQSLPSGNHRQQTVHPGLYCQVSQQFADLAQSNLVVIKSRNHGSYKLVPVEDSDFIISDAELLAKINRGIAEFEQGR
ncbi:MAG: hypothetical protein KBS53_06430, partial [Bacteroidales bacterium]|nr:hypothetical protein [Candidatus Hennigimonas equi]